MGHLYPALVPGSRCRGVDNRGARWIFVGAGIAVGLKIFGCGKNLIDTLICPVQYRHKLDNQKVSNGNWKWVSKKVSPTAGRHSHAVLVLSSGCLIRHEEPELTRFIQRSLDSASLRA